MVASPEALSRRRSLGLLLASGSSLLLGGCALNDWSETVGEATQPLNERLEALLQGQGTLPEFRRSQVQPEALLVNSFNGTPTFAPGSYRLVVNGAVARPLSLDLAALAALPQRECVIRHVCVEGWAAIVAWSGPRLADVLALAGPSPLGAYLAIRSADQYFETWDLASRDSTVDHSCFIWVHAASAMPLGARGIGDAVIIADGSKRPPRLPCSFPDPDAGRVHGSTVSRRGTGHVARLELQ
jgi:hypothetical protein